MWHQNLILPGWGCFYKFPRMIFHTVSPGLHWTDLCVPLCGRQSLYSLQWPKDSPKRLMPKFVSLEEAQTACSAKALPGKATQEPSAQVQAAAPLSRPSDATAPAADAPKVCTCCAHQLNSASRCAGNKLSYGLRILRREVITLVFTRANRRDAYPHLAVQQHAGDARALLTERRSASQKETAAQV